MRPGKEQERKHAKSAFSGLPWVAVLTLGVIFLGCIFIPIVMTNDPAYMDLAHYNHPPDMEHLFGTDTMGRDIFACIWHGGRISLFIGIAATILSTCIAVTYGALSALSPDWLDTALMRLTEILLSIPNLLLVVLLLACLGKANVFSIALVIGLTSWLAIAKVVRSEVRQLAGSDFLVAARTMGGGFFYILR